MFNISVYPGSRRADPCSAGAGSPGTIRGFSGDGRIVRRRGACPSPPRPPAVPGDGIRPSPCLAERGLRAGRADAGRRPAKVKHITTCIVPLGIGISMITNRLVITGLAVVLALGTLGFNWVETVLPAADAHGVQAQLQSRFIQIQDETFNRQSMVTGEVLTLNGRLISLVERDLRGWISIFSESTNAGNRWEVLARDPPGNVFDIQGNEEIEYSISARALEAGVYHVHTQLNVASVGPGLGPGQTVVVAGEPIIKAIPYTNIAYQSIIIGVGYVITFATRPWQVI